MFTAIKNWKKTRWIEVKKTHLRFSFAHLVFNKNIIIKRTRMKFVLYAAVAPINVMSLSICLFHSFFYKYIFVSQYILLFEKCSLRSFDNRNYVIAHLLVCFSFAHTYNRLLVADTVFLFRWSWVCIKRQYATSQTRCVRVWVRLSIFIIYIYFFVSF